MSTLGAPLLLLTASLLALNRAQGYAIHHETTERRMHPVFNFKSAAPPHTLQKRSMPFIKFDAPRTEEYSYYWNSIGQYILEKQIAEKSQLNMNLAKNIILFLGDGMSIPTLTAGRVYLGGEEKQYSFERFPYVGLSKTYCTNTQVADSACTATAYLGGVKTNYGTIGVSAAIEPNDCLGQNNTLHHVTSIAAWAQQQGMATGLVTTTSVTHASPAGVYAHIANRNWENDAEVLSDNGDPLVCTDIATQLVHGDVGSKLNVILGGGRKHFLPNTERELDGEMGQRLDGHNLIKVWQTIHGKTARYVQTRDELLNLPTSTTRVLGLFGANHMPFHLDADAKQTPTLAEMTSVAIDILERQSNGRGFFLFVEGGRIDHAHHDTLAMKALDETAEFDKAITLAHARTNASDTLTVVTSDHSHTMSVAGYSSRKNDIIGVNNGQLADDQLPYATLSYANGPGFDYNVMKANGAIKRKNLHKINMKNKDYPFPSMVPLESETHGGDDVGVFASGPFAHLFTGNYEQNFLPHAIAYAACLQDDRSAKRTACTDGLLRERM
ncbi:alkaline phosphatase-like [Rhagoletis pomonella]|uniref:alkaline phosphatase-like n=1 Tax=Rhagoletis pomonella TaxID=28610 RepID=UPI001780A70F|nr:alkaline phosphatase-like [Rhagoletis pomonella]